MMKKIFVYFAFLCTLLCACNYDNAVNNIELAHKTIVINPKEAENVNYSQVFSSAEYIPIPTDSNFLIGNIDKISVSDNYILLMDKSISRSVFVFHKQENKKGRIHKQGNGPGEYVAMKDIYFDANQQLVGIYCGIRGKLLYYNIQGEYKQEQTIPLYTTRIYPIFDNYLLFCDYVYNQKIEKGKSSPNVILTSKNGEIASSADFFNKDINRSVVSSSNPDFSAWDDTLSIKPDHCNIIYHATTDSIYPAYKLDFGQYTLDARYWNETRKRGATVEKVNDYCKGVGICESLRMLEDRDYLFFKYKHKGNINSVFYSKKTDKMIHARLLMNDMDQITAFYPILLQENKIYCLLSIDDIFTARQFLSNNQLFPKDILERVEEFDNPIIVAFTIRNF
jgi:hypothetical protein